MTMALDNGEDKFEMNEEKLLYDPHQKDDEESTQDGKTSEGGDTGYKSDDSGSDVDFIKMEHLPMQDFNDKPTNSATNDTPIAEKRPTISVVSIKNLQEKAPESGQTAAIPRRRMLDSTYKRKKKALEDRIAAMSGHFKIARDESVMDATVAQLCTTEHFTDDHTPSEAFFTARNFAAFDTPNYLNLPHVTNLLSNLTPEPEPSPSDRHITETLKRLQKCNPSLTIIPVNNADSRATIPGSVFTFDGTKSVAITSTGSERLRMAGWNTNVIDGSVQEQRMAEVCPWCEGIFMQLTDHMEICPKKSSNMLSIWPCPQCGAEFDTQPDMRMHVYACHTIIAANGPTPPKPRRKRKSSSPLPTQMPMQQCASCSFRTRDETKMLSHTATVHMTMKRPHLCARCGRAFDTRSSRDIHFRIHTGEQPFKCDICHKTFNQRSNYQTHVKKRHNACPFKCRVCPQAFKTANLLKGHAQIHHSAKV